MNDVGRPSSTLGGHPPFLGSLAHADLCDQLSIDLNRLFRL